MGESQHSSHHLVHLKDEPPPPRSQPLPEHVHQSKDAKEDTEQESKACGDVELDMASFAVALEPRHGPMDCVLPVCSL